MVQAERRVSAAIQSAAAFEKRVLRYQGRIPSTDDLVRLLRLRASSAEQRLAFAEDDMERSVERRLTASA